MEWQIDSEYSTRQAGEEVDWAALRFYLKRCNDTIDDYESKYLGALGYRLVEALVKDHERRVAEVDRLREAGVLAKEQIMAFALRTGGEAQTGMLDACQILRDRLEEAQGR